MKTAKPILALAAGMLFAMLPGWAQQPSANPSSKTKSTHAMDANQRAANLLYTVNQGEVNSAKIMQDHAQNSAVKDFAKMLASDHQSAQDQLQTAASQSNITLAANPAMAQQNQAMDTRLKTQSGPQADRSFVNSEIKDHTKALGSLRRLEPNVTDPQIKSAVDSCIPVIQKHLDAAKKLQSQLGGSGQ